MLRLIACPLSSSLSLSLSTTCVCFFLSCLTKNCLRPSERRQSKGKKNLKQRRSLEGALKRKRHPWWAYTKTCSRPSRRGQCKGRKNLKQGRRLGAGLKKRSGGEVWGGRVLRRVRKNWWDLKAWGLSLLMRKVIVIVMLVVMVAAALVVDVLVVLKQGKSLGGKPPFKPWVPYLKSHLKSPLNIPLK